MAKFATHASGAIWWPILQLMQVAPFGGQICNLCKWRHLVVKFATNASGAIWLTNTSGILFSWRDNSSFRCYTLGPLCLWQCFIYIVEVVEGIVEVTKVPKNDINNILEKGWGHHWGPKTTRSQCINQSYQTPPSNFSYCSDQPTIRWGHKFPKVQVSQIGPSQFFQPFIPIY